MRPVPHLPAGDRAVIHHIGPVLPATDVCDCEPPDGMRDRFLRRASAAGLNLHPGPVLASSERGRSVPTPVSKTNGRARWISMVDRMRAWYSASVRLAVPAVAALVCGFVGYFIAQAQLSAPPVQVTLTSPAELTTVAPKSATSADAAAKL